MTKYQLLLLWLVLLLPTVETSRRRAHAAARADLGIPDSDSSRGELVAGGRESSDEDPPLSYGGYVDEDVECVDTVAVDSSSCSAAVPPETGTQHHDEATDAMAGANTREDETATHEPDTLERGHVNEFESLNPET